MSNKAITWAYEFDLSSGPKFVLVCLADHADEKNSCYPGQDRIAEMTGMSRSSVGRHLRQLEEYGLISRERRSRSDGSGRSSDRYVLNLSFNAADFNVSNFNVAEFNVESSAVQCVNLPISMSHSDTGTLRNPKEPSGRRAKQLPKGWEPSQAHVEKAKELGLDLQFEASQFTSHHLAKGSTFKNWDMAFHNWLGKSKQFSKHQSQPTVVDDRLLNPWKYQ